MTAHTINIAEGEGRKSAAFRLLIARRESLIRRARRALLAVLLDRGEATADDVRGMVPLPSGVNPKVFGAVPGELADLGIIEANGFVKSVRPEAHARPVQRWKLKDRNAAFTWLASHEELPDVPEDRTGDFGNLFDHVEPAQR